MAKVRTFSRYYPKGHPKEGQATFFVEKLVKSLHQQGFKPWDIPDDIFITEMYYLCEPKKHTIRAGKHFKPGDIFSPRIWSGKPYASKQIIIAQDIKVKKVWDFEMIPKNFIDECVFLINRNPLNFETFVMLCKNDGLTRLDFATWFCGSALMSTKRKPFKGQIICWSEDVEY